MDLALSSREQASVAEAVRTLASPFEHASVRAWGEAVVVAIEATLQHEKSWFQLPVPTPTGTDEVLGIGYDRWVDEAAIEAYREFEPFLVSTGAFERGARLGVVTHREAYGPHYEAVMESPYIREFLPSVGVFDMLALNVPVSDCPTGQHDVAQVILNTDAPDHAFSERQVQLAQLLHPALKAGIVSFRELAAVRDRLGALLDASGATCAVFSLEGRLLHRTPALEAVLAREPRRERLVERARRLVRSLAPRRRASLEAVPVPTPFTGARGRYTLVPTHVRDLAPQPAILVSVVTPPAAPHFPTEEEIRERFGLTRRQAEVALLLAERRSNKEIAAALGVSVHTARHHVEGVLKRMDVDRNAVRDALGRPAAE